jgi:hypothetical protein
MICPNLFGKGVRMLKCKVLTETEGKPMYCAYQRYCPSRGKYVESDTHKCTIFQETLSKDKED